MTLKDIAELANTSISTVSRSLNDSDLVAEETKRRIKSIAAEHGFEFNASARGLVTSQTGTIGIILPPNYDRFDVQLYHAALHNDFRKSLEQADRDVIVSFRRNRFTGVGNIEKLLTRKKVDGLIIVQAEIDPEAEAFLAERGVPFVMTQYPPPTATPAYDVVYSDNWTGGKLVADHFVRRGFTTPACITGGEETQSQQRVAGFTETLAAHGIALPSSHILAGDFASESAVELVRANARLFRSVDAVFAVNDLMAFGAMQALQKLGRRVPDEIAVVGYDDTPLAAIALPALTSVHQSREEIALLACELLFDKIARKAAGDGEADARRTIAIQPRLVIRQSSEPEEA